MVDMDTANPFAVLSLIVAPAVLTNASSVLAMSTSNRLARAVDRARELSRQLEGMADPADPETARRLRELAAAEQRTILLLGALRSFYIALGGFASATLVSLLGAVVVSMGAATLTRLSEVIAVLAGLVAVGAIVHGSVILVRETRIAVQTLHERAETVRLRIGSGPAPGPQRQ